MYGEFIAMKSYHYKAVVMPLFISVVLMSTACTTMDPYTQEQKTSNAVKGAAIGAAAGAAVGLITGDETICHRQQR